MPYNRIELEDGTVLMDITDSTVTADKMLAGASAYDASGNKINGELEIISMEDFLAYIGGTN